MLTGRAEILECSIVIGSHRGLGGLPELVVGDGMARLACPCHALLAHRFGDVRVQSFLFLQKLLLAGPSPIAWVDSWNILFGTYGWK